MLSGAVEFEQDGRVYTLNEGDSIYYESSKPFRLMNPGDVTAEIVGVRTPAEQTRRERRIGPFYERAQN